MKPTNWMCIHVYVYITVYYWLLFFSSLLYLVSPPLPRIPSPVASGHPPQLPARRPHPPLQTKSSIPTPHSTPSPLGGSKIPSAASSNVHRRVCIHVQCTCIYYIQRLHNIHSYMCTYIVSRCPGNSAACCWVSLWNYCSRSVEWQLKLNQRIDATL